MYAQTLCLTSLSPSVLAGKMYHGIMERIKKFHVCRATGNFQAVNTLKMLIPFPVLPLGF